MTQNADAAQGAAVEEAEPTALVPARMVNEVLYCERLMYLEWVQGEWAENEFTVDGAWVHRRADSPRPLKPAARRAKKLKGAEQAPAAAASGADASTNAASKAAEAEAEPRTERPYQARSVWLSSVALGVTAKIDVVAVDGGQVMPIEYKRGRQPQVPEGAYLPERAQLCVHVLLLREHGFQCERGALYFAAEQRRVEIDISPELIAATLGAVARIRELCRSEKLPPPLVNSPKCRGCSLVGICLPDEVNQLAQAEEQAGPTPESPARAKALKVSDGAVSGAGLSSEPDTALRRLHPARDDKQPLLVQEHGARVGLDGQLLKITSRDGEVTTARLPNTSHVALYGNAQISTQATVELLRRGIPVCYFSTGGYFLGRTIAHDANNVLLRVAQYEKLKDPARRLALASSAVQSKIANCRTLVRRNSVTEDAVLLRELKHLGRKALEAESLETLLGIEGTAARAYFSAFPHVFKPPAGPAPEFDWNGRNRRPPTDPVNAMLSLCYSLLTKDFALAITLAGLDSMFGFYHQPRFGRPALALDLMEEFRPLVADSVVITAVNTGEVGPGDFIQAAGSCALTSAGRRRLIAGYERRMASEITHPVFGYRISYRRVLEVQARLFARLLLGEIERFPQFRTR